MSVIVKIRLSEQHHARYMKLAKQANVGLSTYLRRHLEGTGDTTQNLAELRLELASAFGQSKDNADALEIKQKLGRIEKALQQTTRTSPDKAAGLVGSGLTGGDLSMLILETNLLLRFFVQPQIRGEVRGEMERHGFKPWAPPSPDQGRER